ncbi:MAG TPA: hypothetical protein DIV86_07260, partial [Alphaproteobacteria bacterium]|nr:hypothetical protein [Alphaproteobacteria bacterium]
KNPENNFEFRVDDLKKFETYLEKITAAGIKTPEDVLNSDRISAIEKKYYNLLKEALNNNEQKDTILNSYLAISFLLKLDKGDLKELDYAISCFSRNVKNADKEFFRGIENIGKKFSYDKKDR